MLTVEKTTLPRVMVYHTPTHFQDHRGTYVEVWNEAQYQGRDRSALPVRMVADDVAVSRRGVLRGLHGDDRTWKLITCLHGRVFLAVACWDHESPFYLKVVTFWLKEPSTQVLVPPKHVNGHLVLSDMAVFHYMQSQPYKGMDAQYTVAWNDPRLKIEWPLDCLSGGNFPVVSKRDAAAAAKVAEDAQG